MIYYPMCPECGERATHKPLCVADGRVSVFIRHDHRACSVTRYVARVDSVGRQDNIALGPGERFEDWYADDAA